MYTTPLTTDVLPVANLVESSSKLATNGYSSSVALTEKWAQKYGDKGIGFYAIHLGWVATAGVAMSLSSFSKLEMCLCVC
ncbi:hypothetical protein HanHA300_Chr00c0047g0699361 [Helianthus annuus]|nr:hypothetical protein HanHA89_Chr11g0412271 [Helianthus annuus]KAJ0638770.1 hypothetical protein HanHA300_Chr00c0047g0699361 [Helianthus annuus]KAJ0684311.1 hypothetical protein HanLR1_Chr11g0389791 [Helianthus annuus]KAJ0688252.1 hypothetical protein HanOQP8_Chr11g0392281 [Helianthus annuus]